MKKNVMNMITLGFLTIIVVFMVAGTSHATEQVYGKMNIAAINSGNLQLKGITWCKKYFDKCVVKEHFTAGTLSSREIVDPAQYITMQTGIENPEVVNVDAVGAGRHRIIFVYDQNREHKAWVPEYIEK